MQKKRILLTGASTGIGAATATIFAENGAEIVSLDIKEAPEHSNKHIYCDLSNPSAIDEAIEKLEGTFDALLNIAGVPGTVPAETIMRVNTIGLRQLTERVFEKLNNNAAIVNVASIAGFNWARRLKDHLELLAIDDYNEAVAWCANRDMDGNTAYHFSKEAVVVYSMQLAGRGIKRGIRANSVSPGPVATPLLPAFKEQAGHGQLDWVISEIGGAAEPDDIGRAIFYLASEQSNCINGVDITIDRGFSAGLAMGWVDKNQSPIMKARAAEKK